MSFIINQIAIVLTKFVLLKNMLAFTGSNKCTTDTYFKLEHLSIDLNPSKPNHIHQLPRHTRHASQPFFEKQIDLLAKKKKKKNCKLEHVVSEMRHHFLVSNNAYITINNYYDDTH